MYLCVDVGGTKTLIAAFSKRGRVIRRRKFKTAQGYRDFIRELSENLADFRKYHIIGAVVAIPGVVTELPSSAEVTDDAGDAESAENAKKTKSGRSTKTAKTGAKFEQKNYSVRFGNRTWADIDLLTPIKNVFNCPVWFENDANLATLYEGFRLPGRTIFLTFSTGIGGGIVEHNRILPESNDFEPGHWRYEYKGETKEWEDIAAASALEGAFHVEYATTLKKDEQLSEVAERVALGLPRVVADYHPRTIILGGPLGRIFKLYAKFLPEEFRGMCRRPKRPNESVIYGGYIYAKQKAQEK